MIATGVATMSDATGFSTDLVELVRFIGDRTGLHFSDSRRRYVEVTLRRAIAASGAGSAEAYRELLASEQAALDALLTTVTVGETFFFREPAQLDFIRREAVPELVARAGGRELKVWSAGCASGEEPYSLAIMLQEMQLPASPRILGTDLSRERLDAARRACYGKWSLRGVSEDIVERYFRRVRTAFELLPSVRSCVSFRYGNLAAPTMHEHERRAFDLVLCRNVLIYLEPEAIERAARHLLDALADGGWLFMGASDPALADYVPCEVVVTGAGVAYRRARGVLPRWAAADSAGGSSRIDALITGGMQSPAVPSAPDWERSAREARPASAEVMTETAGRQHSTPATPSTNEAGAEPSTRLLEEARRAYEARDYERSVALARQHLKSASGPPDAHEAHVLLVRALANLGRLSEAGSACAAALDAHRTSAELVYLQSVLLSAAGQHRAAAAAARRALYLDRTLVVAHLALGGSLASDGAVSEAARAFRNAERLLASLPADECVPASDGERAAGLLALARSRLRLLTGTGE